MKQICTKCKKEREKTDFNFKNKANNKRATVCKICQREYKNNYYHRNKEELIKKNNLRNKIQRKKNTEFLFEFFKTHHCVDCGESNPIVLDFDHIHSKSNNISSMNTNGCSIDAIKKEIEKCEVRCANCHRKKTAKDFNWYMFQLTQK